MADITVDVNLPSSVSVDVTSPTQSLATNISIPGPQGPRGEKGNPTSINNLTAENIIITGSDGNIVYNSGLGTIFISGNSGYFQSAVNSLTTNLNSTGANLNTSINNLSGLFTGYTGSLDNNYATDAQLANTGSTLNTKIDNLSGYVNSQDSNISNNLASTGSALQSNINTLSSNLNSTGSNLNDKITSLSGTLTGNYLTTNIASSTYATISNLNSTGSTLNSSISSLSGTLTSDYATIINLASTGSNLQNQINSLDNVYATDASVTAVANNLASTGSTLETKIGSLSGTLTSDYATITNLASTGSTLNNNINSLSGTLTSNYATITNLASTGSTLTSSINSLNSAFTGFTGNLDATYATDTQLVSTGSTLVNSINSLSGYINSTSSNIIFTTGNQIKSGRLAIGDAIVDSSYPYTLSLQSNTPETWLEILNHSGANQGVFFGIDDNNFEQWNSQAGDILFVTSENPMDGTERLRIKNNGKVGIGTSSPSEKLEVAGNIKANNLVYNTGDQTVSGIKTFNLAPIISGNPFITGNLSLYATVTNLASTGSTLNNSINSLSGTLTSTYATINNLASTGSTLATNLVSTGLNLDAKINTLSGSAVLLYGNQTINGLKDFTTRPTVNTTPVLLSGESANGLTVLVKNDDSVTLNKGQPVYIYGANGNNILVRKAVNTGEATSSKTLGLLNQSLAPNAQGLVVTEGALEGIDTNAGNAGDPIWLGPTGNLIFGLAQKPYAPNHLVYLGVIERKQQNNGKIYVKVQNGFELQELHNVNIDHKNALNDSDILRYNSSSGLWFNETLNTGIFQTQINSLSGSSVLLYGDQSVGGVKTFRDNVYINNLFVTGTETIVNTPQINIASNYLLLNLTGGAVDGGIFFVTGSGLTGVNDSGPIIGFDHVNKFKFGVSTRNSDLSSLPDIASVQDIIAYSGVADNKFSTITNLASTGNTLEGKISSLSGTLTSTYATISNLSSTGSTLQSNINTVASNLITTGNTLQSNINTVSSNLISTGNTLEGKISSLSGTLTSNYGTITNLASTGSTLQTNINNLSGYINSTSSNILFTTGDQTINGNKSFTSSSVLTVKTISGFKGSNPDSLNLIATNDNTVVANVNLPGNINLTAGTGSSYGTSTYGNINLNAGGPKYDGTINVNGNININNTSSLSTRNIIIYKTGMSLGSPAQIAGLTIDNNNISLNNPGFGGTGFGLLISGVLVTPALYATSANLASTGSTLVTNLASTGSTLNTTINNLSGYINSTSSNIVFTTGNQTISGTKTFIQDTTFGDSAQGDFLVISGNQFTVYGSGNFTSGLFVNGNAVLTGVDLSSYATVANLASTGSTLDSKINNLSGVSVLTFGDQTINGLKTFTSGIDIYSGTSPQSLRIFNSTGTNSGEFALIGWQRNVGIVSPTTNALVIGTQASNSGILRDVIITGENIALSPRSGRLYINGTSSLNDHLLQTSQCSGNITGYITGFGFTGNYTGNYEGGYFLGRTKLTQNTIQLLDSSFGSNYVTKSTNAPNERFRSIAVSSDGRYQIVAVNDFTSTAVGYIYVSNDYGNTWIPRITDTTRSWLGAAISADGKYQVACHYGGYIYVSNDYGNTWNAKDSVRYWRSIAISSDGKYQTAVSTTGVYISNNYGNTWTGILININYISIAMSSDGKYQYLILDAGVGGTIYRSSDYGNTWVVIQSGSSTNYDSIATSADGKYVIHNRSSSNNLYISNNYGNTFVAKSTAAFYNSVAVSDNGKYMVAGRGRAYVSTGGIYFSSDYGNTWKEIIPNSNLWTVAISSNAKYVIGVCSANAQPIHIFKTDELIDGNLTINNNLTLPSGDFYSYNATGVNSGEFGLIGWRNNQFVIGSQQSQNGILRDVIITGNNININGSGALNIFDNTNIVGNLVASGSGIFTSGIDLNNSKLINAAPDLLNVSANFNITGTQNSRVILANSPTIITGSIVSGNPIGFNTSIIQISSGQVLITGIGSNVIVSSYNNQFRTAAQYATISILHTGNDGYIMYGNTST